MESVKLYRQIYNAKNNKARRCKTPDAPLGNPAINSEVLTFVSLAKQWKADVKAGVKTEAEYIEWLKAVKEKKVL